MSIPIQQYMRDCEVVIGAKAKGQGLSVRDLRIQFEVTKTITRTPNTAIVKIYNLAPDNEAKIKGEFDEVLINAGYKGSTALLFRGNIRKSFSYRAGNDWITELDAADGDHDFRLSAVNLTLAAGSTTGQLVDHVVDRFSSVTKGHVEIKERKRARGRTVSKMARDVLDEVAADNDASWSFQDEKLVIVPADSTLPNEAIVIRADTGMLGAPELDDKGIKVKCLLNPLIRCNGKIWLDNNALKEKIFKEHDRKPGAKPRKSTAKKQVLARLDPDGIYKVIRVVHKGDTRGNDWESEPLSIRLGNPIPSGKGKPQPTRSIGKSGQALHPRGGPRMSDADLQRDQEHSATPEDATRTQVLGALMDVHTALPGIVVSFDAAKQTAVVQPAIKRIWVEDGPLPLPQCVDVPVQFPRGGNFVLTFPIAKGDEVLLCFSERAIDDWWDRGGVREPSEVRYFDLSDAFALPGFSSRGLVPGPNGAGGAPISIDGAELRTLDGTTVIRLEGDTVYIGGKTGSEKLPHFETYRAQEDTLLTALKAFLDTLTAACTGVSTLPQAAVAINAIGPAAALASPAIAAFQAAATTYLATKAKVI